MSLHHTGIFVLALVPLMVFCQDLTEHLEDLGNSQAVASRYKVTGISHLAVYQNKIWMQGTGKNDSGNKQSSPMTDKTDFSKCNTRARTGP